MENMEYTQLGRTGLSVSRLCLGTMNFGHWTAEEDAFAIMDAALEQGINFFDTANVYGGEKGGAGVGTCETLIGKWFKQGGRRRDKVVLAGKVYGWMEWPRWPNTGTLSALHIVRECEASLKRLQTGHLDLYQMHHYDPTCPWEEIWQAMDTLVRQGKVLYVGTSNFPAWAIVQGNEEARRRGIMGIVSEQSKYNLLQRELEMEVIPAAKAYGVAVLAYSPVAGGVLADVGGRIPEGSRRGYEWTTSAIEKNRDCLKKYAGLCKTLGHAPADVAQAWLLHADGITCPIVGPRTMEQLLSSIAVLKIALSDEIMKKLDEIFPPVGPAPEAYAW